MTEPIKPHLTDADVFSDPGFKLSVLRRSPQIPFPRHTHDFSELVIIYGGRGIHFTENEDYRIGSGDVFILTGDRTHGYRELENLQLINILFKKEFLLTPAVTGFDLDAVKGFHALFTWEPRLRKKHRFENRLRLEPPELLRALDYAGRIEAELTAARPGYRALAFAEFILLCGFLSRCYESGGTTGMKEMSRISRILSYMEENTTRSIPISELTDFGGMSESTLLRLFHRITGMSPVEYHNRLRIERVCRLLETTDQTVTEIAYTLGFSDSNYLTRVFKKVIGTPPNQWRAGSGRSRGSGGGM